MIIYSHVLGWRSWLWYPYVGMEELAMVPICVGIEELAMVPMC